MWEAQRQTKTVAKRFEGSGGASPLEGSCLEWLLMTTHVEGQRWDRAGERRKQ